MFPKETYFESIRSSRVNARFDAELLLESLRDQKRPVEQPQKGEQRTLSLDTAIMLLVYPTSASFVHVGALAA
ncbi:hypothetical protein PAALTS15_04106 [Paenibacillus alvei TS-15]|uniref:Uncharacterized protein n=1 Tax=Paenibacillus alvei TS-15 TaxID=1117108 RepID=S9U1W7_PAEAL|nr:hypothetical protein [Paenibacillus alvei]EPY08506.1 hypothetical protein PAALTS15_04106 [Paenibacillus alvei TS-15]